MDINRYNFQYQDLFQAPYFVDKSELLVLLNNSISSKDKNFCFSYPPGFGSTQILNMCEAYFSKECQTKFIFDNLNIKKDSSYLIHLNKHNVIYINMFQDRNLYEAVNDLIAQLCSKYNLENIYDYKNLSELFTIIMNECHEKFIVLIDNYDYFFDIDSKLYEGDKKVYLKFLKNFIIDQPYIELSIFFGISEIKSLSEELDSLEINNYSLFNIKQEGSFLGFNKNDVDKVYKEYLALLFKKVKIDRNELDIWYGGFCKDTYNCTCVIKALKANKIMAYQNTFALLLIIYSKSSLSKFNFMKILNRILDNTNIKLSSIKVDSDDINQKDFAKDKLFRTLLSEGFLTLDENNNIKIPNKECRDSMIKATLKLI
ncbi:MAG: hypothetical protein JJE21_08405 [Spirochaetaceae bacterium]|nr:hypothetical protein [Spirochaetaceae bacterium]